MRPGSSPTVRLLLLLVALLAGCSTPGVSPSPTTTLPGVQPYLATVSAHFVNMTYSGDVARAAFASMNYTLVRYEDGEIFAQGQGASFHVRGVNRTEGASASLEWSTPGEDWRLASNPAEAICQKYEPEARGILANYSALTGWAVVFDRCAVQQPVT